MSTLERAIEIAARAHAGQTDKAGAPYILHPLRVMMAVSTAEQRIAAVLHDVIEDTPVTIADLRAEGFSEAVLDAVLALTKNPGEHRLDAVQRTVRNPIARVVKLADVADNMDTSRLGALTEKDHARIEQYKKVRVILERGA